MKDQGTNSSGTDERKARISSLLRQIDTEIKNKNLDYALELTRQVFQYDLKNLYARAFEERILTMKAELARTPLAPVAAPPPPPPVAKTEVSVPRTETVTVKEVAVKPQPPPSFSPPPAAPATSTALAKTKEPPAYSPSPVNPMEELERHLIEKLTVMLEEKQRQIEQGIEYRMQGMNTQMPSSGMNFSPMQQLQINNMPVFVRSPEEQPYELQEKLKRDRTQIYEEINQQVRAEYQRSEEELRERLQLKFQDQLAVEKEKLHKYTLAAYRSILAAFMQNKLPSTVQENILQAIQPSLYIAETEHAEIERSVKIDVYTQELRDLLGSSTLVGNEPAELSRLQTLYSISDAEHKFLLRKVRRELGIADQSSLILIVDDDPVILQLMSELLSESFGHIVTAESVEKAIELCKQESPDLIICDVIMPGIGGFTFCEQVKQGMYGEALKSTPFVFASGVGDQYFMNGAKQLGAKGYIVKPFTPELLENTVLEALT